MYPAVRLPAYGGPDHVGDAHDQGALRLAVAEGQQSVVGLTWGMEKVLFLLCYFCALLF